MEMTKWFNTKYHYIVPEFSSDQTLQPAPEWLENDDALAGQLGFHAKPVLLGPIIYLALSKDKQGPPDEKVYRSLRKLYQFSGTAHSTVRLDTGR